MDAQAAKTESGGGFRAWYAVVLLGALYIVAFVDRVILALLIEPLKATFDISDTQISLLIGANFALFYAIVGLPMGQLADRVNRRLLILASTAVWAVCTFASGLAGSFWILCVLRIGVAIGEAALSPSAVSMIGDLFPKEKRGRATSVYMALGALGATGGYIVGGLIVGATGQAEAVTIPLFGTFAPWQVVFFMVSAPAVALGLLLLFTVSEPARPVRQAGEATTRVLAWVQRRWRPLVMLFLAGAVGQTMVHGASTWAPSLLARDFGWAISTAGISVGLVTMVGGVGGMVLWPMLAERWAKRIGPDALPRTLAFGVAAGAILVASCAHMTTAWAFLAAYGLAMFMLMGTGVMLMVAIQVFAEPGMRGELMALALLLTALIALGFGPTLVPMASGWFGAAPGELKPGYTAIAVLAGPLAVALALLSRPGLKRLAAEGS